eukprot:CAMPEP_0185706840 /NCGR_PEP_ID=MMETSP1164-20130828/22647_1 /TAXON_ID=1104430 /ORGANISM="Chrysoreinhardia sp, Strain CCMP2950" /LENGTH=44 /DNA_ID= /DNA_START= /DNA_END= /DNA_ORIENTATION=
MSRYVYNTATMRMEEVSIAEYNRRRAAQLEAAASADDDDDDDDD